MQQTPPAWPLSAPPDGGWVVFDFAVEPDGSVTDFEIVSTTDKRFNQAATKSLLSWRYPAGLDRCRHQVRVEFMLER
ncbi:MAG: hypothetical protein HKN49_11315 [Gammaproteobacteria bacterium]|nr:hypothetical protein [Gammaproteobacteria bacterium]